MNDNMFDVIPRCEVTKTLKQVFDAIRAETDDGPYSIPDFLTEMERAINAIPCEDAEPVRHGRWGDYQINGYDGLHPIYEVPCRLCNKYARFKYRFCPHCGAKMDGGTKTDG